MLSQGTGNTPLNNPFVRFVAEPRFRWLRHSLFIFGGLILAFKEDMATMSQAGLGPAVVRSMLLYDAALFSSVMVVLYFTLFISIPKLLFRSRLLLFGLVFISSIVFIYVMNWYLDQHFLRPMFPASISMPHADLSLGNFIEKGLIIGILLGSVTGMKVFQKWINDIRHMNELRETNMKTELEQLKSQVNPHFLFNTLNNLLVLVQTNTEKAAQVLLGLSDLLRYQLYDSSKETILLSKDIKFIENLLSLETIRKEDFSYEVNVNGKIDGVRLPPFLFIPFVENAVKHGASTVGHSFFRIGFRVEEASVHFSAENSKPHIKQSQPGGIGLKNIRRRLELLYPGTHQLDIHDTASQYKVDLILPI